MTKQLMLALTAIACFGAFNLSMMSTAEAKSNKPPTIKPACKDFPAPKTSKRPK